MPMLYAGGVLFIVLLTRSLSLASHQVLSKLLEAVGVTGPAKATIAGWHMLNAKAVEGVREAGILVDMRVIIIPCLSFIMTFITLLLPRCFGGSIPPAVQKLRHCSLRPTEEY